VDRFPADRTAAIVLDRMSRDTLSIANILPRPGLSNEDISHRHWLMRIPTTDLNRSMNLG
jgi:hypothetical protein